MDNVCSWFGNMTNLHFRREIHTQGLDILDSKEGWGEFSMGFGEGRGRVLGIR